MAGLFYDVLEVNIGVSVIILMLCLLSGKLRKRYGAAWMRTAWILVAVRLMIPYNYSLPVKEISLLNMPGFEQERNVTEDMNRVQKNSETGKGDTNPVPTQSIDAQSTVQSLTENSGQSDGKIPVNNVMPTDNIKETGGQDEEIVAGRNEFSYTDILVKIWIFGIAAGLIYFISGYLLFRKRFGKNLKPVKDISLKRKFPVPVYQSGSIASPALIGIFCPKLIIPTSAKQWSEEEFELIIMHEFYHYKSKDILFKAFMTIVCCMNWFNPAVYLMKRQFFYDIELACDEKVLMHRNKEEREAYARIMLSFAGRKRGVTSFSTGFGESKKQMKKRIDHVMDTKKKKKGIFSIIITVGIILTMSILVSCGYKPEDAAEKEILSDASMQREPETEQEDFDTEDAEAVSASFDYNHEYNQMLRCYENDVYLDREDGIYRVKDGTGEEELVFQNTYQLSRGMEIYKDSLYFCGSVQRGGEEKATIYRMHLDTLEVEDALALFSQSFDALYHLSVYEDKLYAASGYAQRIGFELDGNGRITKMLDETADDFLFREYNDYMELQLSAWNNDVEYDSEEYWEIIEQLKNRYEAVMDVAACKKMLNGNQIVSKYKDELLRSIYLEKPDGTYEYLCDSIGFPMIITQTGLYYAVDESGTIWFTDFETGVSKKIYERKGREWEQAYLINYDNDYVYLLKSRSIGYDLENNRVEENYLMRVSKQDKEAEKVYQFESDLNLNSLMHCAVYGNRMYFENHETIALDPDANGMQNDGEMSEDAEEMTRTAKAFAAAYFQNDTESLRSYLSEDFEGSMEAYPYPEAAGQIEGTYISGLPEGNLETGVCCALSYEFKGNAEADEALTYLDMEMIKTQQGFKIKSYGLEM